MGRFGTSTAWGAMYRYGTRPPSVLCQAHLRSSTMGANTRTKCRAPSSDWPGLRLRFYGVHVYVSSNILLAIVHNKANQDKTTKVRTTRVLHERSSSSCQETVARKPRSQACKRQSND